MNRNKFKNKTQLIFKTEERILVLTITMVVAQDREQDRVQNSMIETEQSRYHKPKINLLILDVSICNSALIAK